MSEPAQLFEILDVYSPAVHAAIVVDAMPAAAAAH
jgi:hypothetical protein